MMWSLTVYITHITTLQYIVTCPAHQDTVSIVTQECPAYRALTYIAGAVATGTGVASVATWYML